MTRPLAALALLAATSVFAQSPSFEVASIKPNNSGSGNSSTHTNHGQLVMENTSLKSCIEQAFDVKDYSLSAPDWLDSARFDIVAKSPAGAPRADLMPMLQALLVERFHLAFHRETRDVSAYALVLDRNGPKFHKLQDGITAITGITTGRGLVRVKKSSMAKFADVLSRQLDRPIQDLTGLDGIFDLEVQWAPEDSQPSADTPAGPSIFAAMQEQLGLKLEARKLPLQVLVVDRLDRVPTDN